MPTPNRRKQEKDQRSQQMHEERRKETLGRRVGRKACWAPGPGQGTCVPWTVTVDRKQRTTWTAHSSRRSGLQAQK